MTTTGKGRLFVAQFIVKKAVLSAPTSPCTTKCPDPAIIRDLVFHKPVAPEITKDVALHLTECPDCARIALTYTS